VVDVLAGKVGRKSGNTLEGTGTDLIVPFTMVKQVTRRTKAAGGGGDSLANFDMDMDDSNEWTVSDDTNNIVINQNQIINGNRQQKITTTIGTIHNYFNQTIIVNENQVVNVTTNGEKTVVTRGKPKSSVSVASSSANPPAKKAKTTNKKDIMSDPRLQDFFERSKYEAYRDPYRGIFPCFHVSFPVEESHCNGIGSTDDKSLKPGQNVFVDSEHPAVIESIDEDTNTAVVKYSTTQTTETVHLDQITPMDTGKTRSGRSSTANSIIDRNREEMTLDIDEPSPWMKCSHALDPTTWEYTHPQGAQVINLDTPDQTEKEITVVKSHCPSINEWAQYEWEMIEKERVAELKKKRGKKGKKKKEEVVVLDESDGEQQEVKVIETKKDEIICGRREEGECACDYNPVSFNLLLAFLVFTVLFV
jgi:uncharacterized protein YbaA (DUF1428 family)